MKPRPAATLTSPAPCGAFLCLSASPLNRAAALPSALPLYPSRPVPCYMGQADKPRRPAAAASLCPIGQSPAAGRLCRPLTVPPLPFPFAGTLPAPPPPRKGGKPRRRCPTVAAA